MQGYKKKFIKKKQTIRNGIQIEVESVNKFIVPKIYMT